MTATKDEEIRAAVREAAPDGRAPCRSLLAIAERLGVEPGDVGRACNEMNVRIYECQLGCFR
jgi:hypothetical protein